MNFYKLFLLVSIFALVSCGRLVENFSDDSQGAAPWALGALNDTDHADSDVEPTGDPSDVTPAARGAVASGGCIVSARRYFCASTGVCSLSASYPAPRGECASRAEVCAAAKDAVLATDAQAQIGKCYFAGQR